MKTKKLIISDLKVQSFITSLHGERGNTVKGGISGSGCTDCNWSADCLSPTEACPTANTCSLPGVICNTNPGPGNNNNTEMIGN